MGLHDKNMLDRDCLTWVAAGFAAITVGLIGVVYSPYCLILCGVGLVAFLLGYTNVNPFREVTGGHMWAAVFIVVALLGVLAVAAKVLL